MKNYNLSDDLTSAVRSLPFFYQYYSCLSRQGFAFIEKLNAQILSFPNADHSNDLQFIHLISRFGVDDFMTACKAVHNAYMRTTRCRSRLDKMMAVYGRVYFITLTLEDSFLSYDKFKLLDYAKSILGQCGSMWVLNDDYGDQSNRLHFHAVCLGDLYPVESLQADWWFGFVKIDCCDINDLDDNDYELNIRRISRYVTKLARHCLKDTTCKVYYSRKKRSV